MTREDLIKLKQDNRNNDILKNLIGVIIGECDRIGKDLSAEQIITVIKKIYKNNDETIKQANSSAIDSTWELSLLLIEQDFLEQYIPKQLSEDEITAIVKDFTDKGINNLGIIMKYFKNTHAGLYDGAVVSKIAKKCMNKIN